MDKKVPYGISNFQQLRKDNYLYIDKTKYIEILEEDVPYQFFIRPRRFGKSLFLSMLSNYYDINKKDEFKDLFNDLYIGNNPTEKKNSYLILDISFAGLITDSGKERFIQSFDNEVIEQVAHFIRKYSKLLNENQLPSEIKTAEHAIKYIVLKAVENNQRIFVLIDEYDNFANDLIGKQDRSLYYELLQSEGYVRTFYKTLKDGTTKSIERIFMTGVSPIMLDDLTSGFNITSNITLEDRYNSMLGFTDKELKMMLDYYKGKYEFSEEELIKDLKKYYNGYLFSKTGKTRVYNTNMVLYFIGKIYVSGKYPENILDENIKTDYKKIESIAFNFKDDNLVDKLLIDGEIENSIVDRFNLEYMYEKKENFISILYYMGMLTIKESLFGDVTFGIPNLAVKSIYWEYFIEKLIENYKFKIENNKIKKAIKEMALKGEIELFKSYFTDFMSKLSNRDLTRFDEKHIKILLMALFMNNVYIPNSEYEVEGGFIDILLTKNKAFENLINYEWLIELKYIKKSDINKFEKIKKDGIEQIYRYSKSEKLNKSFDIERMKKLLIIVTGKHDIYMEIIES